MERILVGVDGSAPSLSAVQFAADLASKYDAELILMTIVPRLSPELEPEAEQYARVEHIALPEARLALTAAGNVLGHARTEAVAKGATRVSAEPCFGDPAREIITTARDRGADLIVVGTPVYRGSYTGAFKHVFDLVRHDRLRGTPVILTATGGNLSHSLVTEHELRPLFGFFGALTLSTTLYATESDFSNYALASDAMTERVALASKEAIEVLRPHVRAARSDLAALSTDASSNPSTRPPTSVSRLSVKQQ